MALMFRQHCDNAYDVGRAPRARGSRRQRRTVETKRTKYFRRVYTAFQINWNRMYPEIPMPEFGTAAFRERWPAPRLCELSFPESKRLLPMLGW